MKDIISKQVYVTLTPINIITKINTVVVTKKANSFDPISD